MDLANLLRTGHLYDCHGRVTHTFVLELDGAVTVTFPSGRTATLEPDTRRCRTPGIDVPPALWSDVAAFARP